MEAYKFFEIHSSSTTQNYVFDYCLVIRNSFSLLQYLLPKLATDNIMVYFSDENVTNLEESVINLWKKYPSVEFSIKTFPFSYSHLSLARTICVAPDINEVVWNEIEISLKDIGVSLVAS